MTPERYQRIKQIFDSALERDPTQRLAFLEQACTGDTALRHEVDSLLALHESSSDLLDNSVGAMAAKLLAEDQTQSLIGQSIGAYKVEREIGRGGMGEVYLARDTRLDRPVAIKLLPASLINDPDRVRRFQQEARATSLLNHPNIVTIHDVIEHEGLRLIVSEYVEGKTLREVINSDGLKLEKMLDVVIQTASALSAAHIAGILHRDIKPENIMVRHDGYVKVLDFGLAKLSGRGQARESGQQSEMSTQTGIVMGTVKYMSPEQARGEKVDHLTDIWSLGVVLYEAVTGQAPFEGETASHTIVAILEREPRPIADYVKDAPAELQRVVDKTLGKNKVDRYQTMGELMDDLQDVREEIAFRARQERRSGESPEMLHPAPVVATEGRLLQRRRGAVLWAVIPVVAVSALAFGAYEYLKAKRDLSSQSVARLMPISQSAKMSRITAHGKISKVALSPDGKYMAYAAGQPRQQGLWVMQVNTRTQTQLIPAADDVSYWQLTFSPDGDYIYYIAFVGTEEVLYRVPKIGGTPKKLLTSIDSAVTFSPDGARMAFLRDMASEGGGQLVVANVDGSGESVLATRKLPDYFLTQAVGVKISWSPDGETIACPGGNTEVKGGNSMEVVGVSLKDGTERPLTRQRLAEVTQVVWLADGSGLVMSARDQMPSRLQVWYLSYPEGEARRLTNDFSRYPDISVAGNSVAAVQDDTLANIWVAPEGAAARTRQITDSRFDGVHGLAWTPDGRLLFCSYLSGNADIWIMDSDGENRKRLTDDAGFDGWSEVSPDGRHIVFVSSRAGDTFNLWWMDFDGGNLKQLTHGNGEVWPRFSPDGRWVYYISSGYWNRNGPLWKIPLDGGEPVLVIDKPAAMPAFSPDKKLIAYVCTDAQTNPPQSTAIAPVEGGPPIKRFRFLPRFDWTPDGRALAYVDQRNINIWAQPLDGGRPVPLTDFKADLTFEFDFSHDGKQLALARGTRASDIVLISDFK